MSTTSRPPLPTWPRDESPFHDAELALQERYGKRAALDAGARRGVRDVLIDQHRAFFAQIPFLLVGSVDRGGQPWASMLGGRPGFAHSPDPRRLRIDLLPAQGDPLAGNLVPGAPLGVLGIELPTRRRNRMSGRLEAVDERGFAIAVLQSYGNCPKYIQARELSVVPASPHPRVLRSDRLSEDDRRMLAQADSFYIASSNPRSEDGVRSGTDVSHRGGRPGFIRVEDERTIAAPDFVGNYFFNTLGNLMVESRAGLLFVDFKTGDLLLAAARAEIVWKGPEIDAFAGAQRLLRLHLTELIRLEGALPLRGSDSSDARELAQTGTWEQAERAMQG